jgi:hypothetical protein
VKIKNNYLTVYIIVIKKGEKKKDVTFAFTMAE